MKNSGESKGQVHHVVTGGICSSLGKGITTASIVRDYEGGGLQSIRAEARSVFERGSGYP